MRQSSQGLKREKSRRRGEKVKVGRNTGKNPYSMDIYDFGGLCSK